MGICSQAKLSKFPPATCETEGDALYSASLKKILYKICFNTNEDIPTIFTWAAVVKMVFLKFKFPLSPNVNLVATYFVDHY